uniref:TLC domain-containing protein n=1 Tax=Panagrellus redivivus TaxID=6233 RepID=A0A7E4WCI1_PANRE
MASFLKWLNSLFPQINYSAITFNDLESPRLVAVYYVFWDVSLVFTTIFFSFMLYMIITKSPREMSDYKWYLVHQLTWSYMFDLCFGLWKPVPLWPFYIGYSAGMFAKVIGSSVTIQLLIVIHARLAILIYVQAIFSFMDPLFSLCFSFCLFFRYPGCSIVVFLFTANRVERFSDVKVSRTHSNIRVTPVYIRIRYINY